MNWPERIENYKKETGFPQALFIAEDGRVEGMWIMGNDYRVKSTLYGGYPAGYLKRIKSLFPDKQNALHLFSGRVDQSIIPGKTVDINAANEPDYIDDILEYKPLVSEKPTKNQESLLFKIKALLNKAESSDSQEEKDAFMMKAQDLIHKNGLTHEKVLAERWDSKSGFKEEDIIEEIV